MTHYAGYYDDIDDDRNRQIGWLQETAKSITHYGEGTGEELASFWESQMASEAIDLPDWFDAHDRALLVKYVSDYSK